MVDFAARLAPLSNDHISSEPGRNIGRMPPPIPPPRRPFSWHRSTTKSSSGSGISPSDERKRPHFPLQSPEITAVGRSLQAIDSTLTGVLSPPPAQLSFSTTLLSGCSSDRSFSAPRPSPSKSTAHQQQMPRHHSSSNITLNSALPTRGTQRVFPKTTPYEPKRYRISIAPSPEVKSP